ncbi:unnamed protein product, partial [Heterotrigona itama]
MGLRNGQRTIITAATKDVPDISIPWFRISESNPAEHDESCLTRIHTVPSDITESLMSNMTLELRKQTKVFKEFVQTWFRYSRDTIASPLEPDKIDLPESATKWLKYIKEMNKVALLQLDLKTTKEYTWSQREITKSGDSLSNLIEFGIQRNKFACSVINALVDELKMASTAGKCRTLIIIDGFNAFTSSITHIKDENHTYVPPERISITSTFLSSVDYNWCNGAAILTVDKRANKDRKDSDYPTYLLGKKGFELLDPFLPICVENYSLDEFKTILEYYKDRKWIKNISDKGQRELELLSNKNPHQLWTLCKPLY